MKTSRITFFTLIAALRLAGVGTVQAEDFTITVPVRLSNLVPEATGGEAPGELAMTGLRFKPKSITTPGEMGMTGLRFRPKRITAGGELTITGLRE